MKMELETETEIEPLIYTVTSYTQVMRSRLLYRS